MKRILAVLLAVLMFSFVLCACGDKSFECEMCEETKSGKSYTIEAAGEKATVCGDCKAEWDKLMNALGDINLDNLGEALEGLEDSLGDLEDIDDSLGDLGDFGDLGDMNEVAGDLID